ncbi:hypothetical protein KAF25_011030 [Fusarium avenaceum]|uniref:Uncharacterized protein n=1 Tax=Fusarium avenaceum TaxID=40199 RepID=A0A9P7KL19_9HYPO|nr:hypothetical protein KAF25_011030 [Fusarium avenaceum]
MAAIPQWLQPLLRAGVLQDAAQLGTVSYSYRNYITKNSASISSSIVIPISSKPPSKPQIKAKRSPVIKAYAHSIRGLLTPESDLGAAGQALFIASPLQKGIPLGVKDEFMNESIYEHGNSVQSPLSPIYRSGHGNYFGWLNKYVSNVEDVFASSDTNATDKDAAYLQAKRDANDEYEKAVARFEKIQKMDPTVRFQDWMNQYATDYVEACKVRDTLAGKLRHSSVKLAKEMLDDAQARLEPKQGNNMPCAVSDVDILRERGTQQEDIVYRPRYYLSGYRSTATRWRDEYYEKAASPEQRFVSFEGLKNKTWAQLGITEPDGDNDIDETPEMDFHITLTYTGLEAFDVKRGLW